jgi:hypothetical protein
MAVDLGEHQIENDRVVSDRFRFEAAFFTVVGDINGVAFFLQSLPEGANERSVIFNQEDAHGPPRK